MSDRTSREKIAAWVNPSAVAGMIAVLKFSQTPRSLTRFQLDAGNHPYWTENNQIKKMPVMKFGTESATCTPADEDLSCQRPSR